MLKKMLVGLVVAIAISIFGASGYAQVKVPSTTEEHVALAKQYKDKADGHRKEAAEHRAMAEAWKKSTTNAQEARGQKNPAVVKMEKHCNAIATAADKLATENEKAADYHNLRAKELQGK